MLTYYSEFLTATILKWQYLLADDQCKQIIIDSLTWLTKEKKCKVYAFVIMPNHVHLIWKITDGYQRQEVQGALLSFTAHTFKKYLKTKNSQMLNTHYVDAVDRTYQFWKRNPMVKECKTHPYFLQKLEYIHNNPCQPHWKLATLPEEYAWSSAGFYELNDNKFNWLYRYSE